MSSSKRGWMALTLGVAALVVTTAACGTSDAGSAAASAGPARNEILWDSYGVPHVYGTDCRRGLLRLWLRPGSESRRRDSAALR